MDARRDGDLVRAGQQARQQFYDARGYGRPVDGELELAPVEAAHLLFRGDLATVGGQGFEAFLASEAVTAVDFLVYAELRNRGFYLSPAREGWIDNADVGPETSDVGSETSDVGPGTSDIGPVTPDVRVDTPWDFIVYPRGKGPWDDAVAHRVRTLSERDAVTVDTALALAASDGVLAVVDEESEVTYFGLSGPDMTGETDHNLPEAVPACLLQDRLLLPDPPTVLHDRAFYGQPLSTGGDDTVGLQLSLLEGAYLAGERVIAPDGGEAAIGERGRAVEGERFDRRLTVYRRMRDAGMVPKTGFKFGADFRTYAAVEDVEDLGHSERLVRVRPREYRFAPRDVALDVRMAHGVRKQLVMGLVDDEAGDVSFLGIERITP